METNYDSSIIQAWRNGVNMSLEKLSQRVSKVDEAIDCMKARLSALEKPEGLLNERMKVTEEMVVTLMETITQLCVLLRTPRFREQEETE